MVEIEKQIRNAPNTNSINTNRNPLQSFSNFTLAFENSYWISEKSINCVMRRIKLKVSL